MACTPLSVIPSDPGNELCHKKVRKPHPHHPEGTPDDLMGWLKELHDSRKFKAVKISTEVNLADDLTKPLAPNVKRKLDLVHSSKYAQLIAPLGGKKVCTQ